MSTEETNNENQTAETAEETPAAAPADGDGHAGVASSRPVYGPALMAGEEPRAGVTVEVVMHEEGLEGSRFLADVLQLRGRREQREAFVQYHALFDEGPDGAAHGAAE